MSTELETKLQELRGLMVVKGDVALVDECIALASLPQQDVGAGRSVPSPVGQAQQQNSDELGECHKNGTGPSGGSVASEGDPLSAAPNVPFANEIPCPMCGEENGMIGPEVCRNCSGTGVVSGRLPSGFRHPGIDD